MGIVIDAATVAVTSTRASAAMWLAESLTQKEAHSPRKDVKNALVSRSVNSSQYMMVCLAEANKIWEKFEEVTSRHKLALIQTTIRFCLFFATNQKHALARMIKQVLCKSKGNFSHSGNWKVAHAVEKKDFRIDFGHVIEGLNVLF